MPISERNKAPDAVSCLETNRHDTEKIDDDLPGDIIIRAIADDNSTLDLSGIYEDRGPYLDTDVKTDAISNVTTRSRKAQMDNNDAREALLEA